MNSAICRMVSVCFATCLLVALPVVAANRAGDADNNKVVANMADAVRTQDGLLGIAPPSQVSPLALVGGDNNVGIDDVMLIAQRATASRAVIEPQLGIVSIVPPSSSSYAHLSPPVVRDFQVVSSSASAQMVDGLDALSFLIAEGAAVESTLSFPSLAVAGGLASVTLNPNNPALPDDTVTTQLFFTIRNSSGTLRESVFDEVIDTVTAPFCGDSVVNPGETCDDGPGGVCFDDCLGLNVCGDGIVFGAEACDDGDTSDCTPACNATCTAPAAPPCGNGVVDCGETCDDSNTNNLDGCEGNCQLICGAASGASRAVLDIGNGTCYLQFTGDMDYFAAQNNCVALNGYLAIINSAAENAFAYQLWQADSWIGFNDTVTEGLFLNVLGGPLVYSNWAGGQPDDFGGNEDCTHFWGGGVWNDAPCTVTIDSICEIPPPGGCGDGLLQLGEFCDSGINNGTCGNCNATCTALYAPTCGDTVAECGETCDDGALNGTCGFCNASCSAPFNTCGDASALCGEVCDDGPGGACFDDCSALNVCGDGITFGGEACDDGANGDPCDGCTDACATTASLCGNGTLECGEVCDDGNVVDGDGCAPTCQIGCVNTVIFEDDFTDGTELPEWTHFNFQGADLWHVSPNDNAPGGTVPPNVLWFVDEVLGSYEYGQHMISQMRGPAIALPTLQPGESLTYSYWENYNTESGWDFCQGGIWDSVYTAYPVAYNSGNSDGWVQRTYDLALAGLAGQTIEPFFEFNTTDDFANNYPGWKVDEVLINYCSMCGNGVVQPGEVCDDGPGGACMDDCSGFNNCGNGAVDVGEACDDGPLNGTCGFCDLTCTGPYAPTCGDAVAECGEVCDDGVGGTCFDDCSALNVCGDSVVFAGETCDDGANGDPCDGCTDTCTATASLCGNSMVECAETCDDGAPQGEGLCLNNCSGIQVCGDSVVNGTEQCDDGNLANGDGCNDVCAFEIPTANFPFIETWESGLFDGWWTLAGTNTWRIDITNAFGAAPEGALYTRMDSSVDGTYSLNELTLRIALAGQPTVVLDFFHMGTGDEPEAMPASFVGSSNSEGVAVSVDGTNWCRVTDLSTRGNSPWALLEFDLVAAMAGCAMIPSTPTFVRFQQYDNFQATADGHFFDRIRLYAPVCGDGLVSTGETCDDGAANGTCGFCSATCAGPHNVCGDGNALCGEACDDGDTDSCTPACNNICTGPAGAPVCGNGVQDCGEQCDDGNLIDGDGCQSTCLLPVCGDGVVDGVAAPTGATLEWVSTACGLSDIEIDVNGVPLFDLQMGGSGCDCNSFVQTNSLPLPAGLAAFVNGANNISIRTNPVGTGNLLAWALLTVNSGAGPQTLVVFSGGNPGGALARDPYLCNFAYTDNLNFTAPHNVVLGENCDDGASNGTCGFCNANCSGAYVPVCGNGATECAEACDDGFTDACGSCDATCTGPGSGATCGDGATCPELEACDDGFTTPCGACNDTCTAPGSGSFCGDMVVCTDTEACDDGGNSPTCDANCTPAACGDGFVNPAVPETCDDGNVVGGDGCEATCQLICGGGTGALRATQDPVNGNCYLGFANALNWVDSQLACESVGGHLATIGSAAENTLARTATVNLSDTWIGINDFGVEAGNPSLFVNVTGGYLTYTSWAGGEPNGGTGENCVHFTGGAPVWNDLPCGVGLNRVCEIEGCGNTVTTPPETCDDGPNTPVTLGSFPDALSLEVAARGNFSYTADIGAGLLNIVDFTNPVVPVPVGQFPLGGINSVELAGKRAYLGADNNGVWVIDTSLCVGPCPGALMGNYFTPGWVYHVAVAPGGRAFVSEAGPALIEELNIAGPVPVPAGPPLGLPDNAYESVPVGNVLYVSALNAGLLVIDITVPGGMVPMGGAPVVQGGTTGLAIQNNFAYVAGGSGLSIFDVSTCIPPAPCAPPLVSAFSSLTGARVEHVTVRGKRAYLASGPEGLVVLDISNPLVPTLIGRIDTPGAATDVALSGMRGYASDATSTQVFNIAEDLLCTDMCAAVQVCGDGVVTGSEVCDDANTLDCDGCRGDCSAVETGCGDGFLCGPVEICDDGVGNGLSQNCNAACTGIAP